MALAGDHEVVVAVQPHLDRAFERVRRDGRPDREVAGLCLLAAEAAAHAPAFHLDAVVVQAQRVRHPVLGLAGVLGAGVNEPLVLLLRQGVGDLALQVEMLLAADLEPALQRVRRARQARCRVTPLHDHGWQHEALRGHGLVHGQHRRQGFDVQYHLARGLSGLHHGVGHHQADDLADMLDRVQREDGLVVREGGQDRVAGNVARQHHAAHAGHGQGGAGIHPLEAAVRRRRQDGRGVQGAAHLRNIVDVRRSAGDLGGGTFMGVGSAAGGAVEGAGVGRRAVGVSARARMHGWSFRLGRGVVRGAHARSCGDSVSREAWALPWLSSQKRCSRLPSTSRR